MSERYIPNLTKQGLYDPRFEHEACGVGLVANVKGVKSHSVLKQGLEVLCNLEHRGAKGADPETGDGAGVLIQMPHEFFRKEMQALGIEPPQPGHYAVGMAFMPHDETKQKEVEGIVRGFVEQEGQSLLGWRDVPVSPGEIGILAAEVMPAIRQFFVGRSADVQSDFEFELKLYVIRRQFEDAVAESGLGRAQ